MSNARYFAKAFMGVGMVAIGVFGDGTMATIVGVIGIITCLDI